MALTRKSALALAGAVAGTLAAAGVAGAVNLGLLAGDDGAPDPNGAVLDIVATTGTTAGTIEIPASPSSTVVEVVVEDVYDLPAGTTPPAAAPTTPLGPPVSLGEVDDDDDDHDDEFDDDHDDEFEDDDHEDDHDSDEDDDHDDDDHHDDDHERGEDDDD